MTRQLGGRGGRGFSLGGKLAVGATGAAGVAGLKKSIDAASDYNEQVSKTETVFGKSSQAVKDWSETTTAAFGVSRREALSTASSFGALFAPLGIRGKEAARLSEQLTQYGADLASFYNTDVASALDALRSGVVGESEPLRKYGVLLTEGRVQQQAMADTGKKNAASLTAQEKVLARVAIITKDTSQAQGDFARTNKNLANQTRQMKANWEDFSVTLGETVIPVVNKGFGAFNDFFTLLRDNSKIGQETFEKGSRLETSLVPDLAKQILQLKKAGKTSAEILPMLRARLGGSLKADDLIAEAFRFTVDPKLRAQIRKAAEDLNKVVEDETSKVRKRRGSTAAERAAAAAAASVRIQGVDARVARQLDRIQDMGLRKQLAGLRTIAQEIRGRLQVTKDTTRRLTLEEQLLGIYREQRSVQEQIGDQIRNANAALKDRADAIKSAVLDRLEARETACCNQRALRDAKERLRIARQLGGASMASGPRRKASQDVQVGHPPRPDREGAGDVDEGRQVRAGPGDQQRLRLRDHRPGRCGAQGRGDAEEAQGAHDHPGPRASSRPLGHGLGAKGRGDVRHL